MSQNDIRVLIVDDDDDMRATLSDFISQMGVKVRTAPNVTEAERLLRTEPHPFEIVLTDLKLPDGTGLDVVKTARARSTESLVTIVTGFGSLESAIEAIRMGAYDYITKPFSLEEIGIQVRNLISRVGLGKENARLSVRLQQLYEELNHLQNEKAQALQCQEEILKQVQESGRKLDLLLSAARPESPLVPR